MQFTAGHRSTGSKLCWLKQGYTLSQILLLHVVSKKNERRKTKFVGTLATTYSNWTVFICLHGRCGGPPTPDSCASINACSLSHEASPCTLAINSPQTPSGSIGRSSPVLLAALFVLVAHVTARGVKSPNTWSPRTTTMRYGQKEFCDWVSQSLTNKQSSPEVFPN